ncbi:SDR family oxidoreductase [Aspergillus foveolatus]|uniref:SDR family oxidoreductase n=1 Tax=Aspergillus foveolatus TaxID=210207 RepID=UPI003CCE2E50
MATYLITGASRGLGLELAAQLAASPSSEVSLVFTTSRDISARSLIGLIKKFSGRVVPVQLDPSDPESLRAAVALVDDHLQGRGLDVLINNSGVQPITPGKIEMADDLTEVLHTNVTLTHLVTRAFLPLLRQGSRKVITNISSTLGSISLSPQFSRSPAHAYKISKAAMNMMTVQYALQYADEEFTVFAVSPGWLRTDMGGQYADLPVETGAEQVLKYVKNGGKELNGRFLNIHVPGWENAPGPNQYPGGDAPW